MALPGIISKNKKWISIIVTFFLALGAMDIPKVEDFIRGHVGVAIAIAAVYSVLWTLISNGKTKNAS